MSSMCTSNVKLVPHVFGPVLDELEIYLSLPYYRNYQENCCVHVYSMASKTFPVMLLKAMEPVSRVVGFGPGSGPVRIPSTEDEMVPPPVSDRMDGHFPPTVIGNGSHSQVCVGHAVCDIAVECSLIAVI